MQMGQVAYTTCAQAAEASQKAKKCLIIVKKS